MIAGCFVKIWKCLKYPMWIVGQISISAKQHGGWIIVKIDNKPPIINKHHPKSAITGNLPTNMGNLIAWGFPSPVNLCPTNSSKMPNMQQRVPRAIAPIAPHENPHQRKAISM
jgi:hypothetical protein